MDGRKGEMKRELEFLGRLEKETAPTEKNAWVFGK